MIPYFQSYNDFINHLNSHYISYRQLFDFSLLNDDAITSMTALAQLCAVNNLISFDHYCLDCASDNVATHKLCYSLGILPVIDINKRGSNKNLYLPYKDI